MKTQITTLSNGVRVLTDRMAAVETVTLGAWFDVGSRHESVELNGVSHLLEHMMFKGTARRSAQQIAEVIEDVGGLLNAWTSRESTAYYAKVLKHDVPLAVDILSDILQHSTFDQGELTREQAVVVQEINQAEDTPDDIVFDYAQATAYPHQAIGRTVLGTPEGVTSITRAAMKGYMDRLYTADSLVIAAAGCLDHDAFVRQIEQAFTNLPRGVPTLPEKAVYRGGDCRIERDLEQVQVVLAFDGVSYAHPTFYPAAVLSTLLGGGMSSRLFQEVREKRGLAYSVYSALSAAVDSGLMTVYAGTGADEVAALMPVMCDELCKVADGVTAQELARARAQLKSGLLMGLESTSQRAETAARQVFIHGRTLEVAEMVEKIEAVDARAIQDAARLIFSSRPTVTALGPIHRMPTYDTICDALAQSYDMRVS